MSEPVIIALLRRGCTCVIIENRAPQNSFHTVRLDGVAGPSETFANMDVGDERTWMYSQRVSEGPTTPPNRCLAQRSVENVYAVKTRFC